MEERKASLIVGIAVLYFLEFFVDRKKREKTKLL